MIPISPWQCHTHGSQPCQVRPSMLASVAWSIKHDTWDSTDKPLSGSRALTLAFLSPRHTDSICLYQDCFECPNWRSSLWKHHTKSINSTHILHRIKSHRMHAWFKQVWDTTFSTHLITYAGLNPSNFLHALCTFCFGYQSAFCSSKNKKKGHNK